MPASEESTGALLARFATGDAKAEEQLAGRVHADLRRLAAAALGGRPRVSIQATEIVHEAWMRIAQRDDLSFADRRAFFALSSRIMRGILVDRARAAAALKRGGRQQRLSLCCNVSDGATSPIDLLALEDLLEGLARFDAESARIVEMRFFGGLTHDEIAGVLDRSTRHVERRWRHARAWLRKELEA